MPAKSKSQQKFFAAVRAYKNGDLKNASDTIKNAANSMTDDDIDDFASTKTKNLPDKIEEITSADLSFLAFNYGIDISGYDMDQLVMGYKDELEHNTNDDIDIVRSPIDPLKIAIAHLREDPKYYTKIKAALSEIRKSIRKLLEAELITSFDSVIRLKVDLTKSNHAAERQYRHDDVFISDSDIVKSCKLAFDKIVSSILKNTIDVGDEILIKNITNDLNIIATIKPANSDNEYVIQVITVMIKPNFRAKNGTYIIRVR